MSPRDRPPAPLSSTHLDESRSRGFSGTAYRFDHRYHRWYSRNSSGVPWLVDLGVLGLVPAILIGVSVLPVSVRTNLAFTYLEPTLLTAFTGHYVHFDPAHLLTNIAAYCLVAPIVYVLCVHAGRRTDFFVAFVTFVLVFPFALSALNMALVRPRIGYGFSGIATAFFGFLPVAFFAYLSAHVDTAIRPRDSPGVFFGTTAVVAIIAVPLSYVTAIVALAGLGITFLYVREWIPHIPIEYRRWPSTWRERTDRTRIGVLAVGVIVVFPALVVPIDPISGSEIVNSYVHLLGYALGFITSYVTFALVGIDAAP